MKHVLSLLVLRMRKMFLGRAWIGTALSLVAAGAFGAGYREGDVEVKFSPSAHLAKILIPLEMGARVSTAHNATGWETLKLPFGLSTRSAIARLKAHREVTFAEPNFFRRPLFVPNDPDFSQQYAPQKIGCENAWNYTLGATRVTIAFIDTGIDVNHPEFAGRLKILSGCNIVDGNSDPSDTDGHGTHCAGIAAAGTNNSIGIAGVCGASIMPVKVFDDNGGGTIDIVSSAYEFAANNGADIISCSLGGTSPSQEELDAVTYAIGKGSIFVAAAGNNGSAEVEYPGGYPNVISVAASDANDAQTSYTEFGNWITVVAPGDQILSTWIGETYQLDSGTSMATPYVAGSLALLKSFAPNGVDSSSIRDALLSTTDFIGGWTYYGRINVSSAMALIAEEEAGSATILPTYETTWEGVANGGSLSSLYTVDGNTVQTLTVSPMTNVQAGGSQLEFLVPTTPNKIKTATFNFSAWGTNGGTSYVMLYNTFKRRFDVVGHASMSASDNSTHSVTLPTNLAPYMQYGKLIAVLRGYLSGSSAGQFDYQIDLTSMTLSLQNAP